MKLSDFNTDDFELIVSLPFKAGVFVSHAEDEDGEVDDEREMDALESCMKVFAGSKQDKPFVADVMRQVLVMKDKWPIWSAQSFNAPEDAERTVALLEASINEKSVKNYRAAVMEIATAVAQAYGEFGEFEDEPSGGLFSGLMNKISDGLSKLSSDDANHPMNISAAEDSALEALRLALAGSQ